MHVRFDPSQPGSYAVPRILPLPHLCPILMTYSRFFLPVVSLLLLAATALPAQAQSMWKQAFGYQTAELLRSPDLAIQEIGLRIFIEVADRQDPDVNLRPAAKALLNVYETSDHPAHRLMAVVALSKIDDGRSYTSLLRSAMNEMDLRTRHTILHAAAGSRSIDRSDVATAYNELLQQSRLDGVISPHSTF